ncbi:hypothetical protein [Streptacidiphilus fuscans]|uniref:Mce-associated membrane protein n=1 Tax=Streptacidiphilus fuscans TaxID=2789292 RepID=A0A931B5Z7_9ACTN|nr:hypothetical protein [Streptacidiphilus fuscans]MBF9069267.1 hypothetical protein [Streptacidiphilus fuscans]
MTERRYRRASAVLLLLATGFAAWFGYGWYAAAHDQSAAFGQSRDRVLAAGEQAVQNLNTLDYRNVSSGLKVWLDSTTGDLHTQLTQGSSTFTSQVQQAKSVTTASVLDGAVTQLDDRAGTASVMVALRITVQTGSGTPAVKESRMLGQLTRTASGWKLSALEQAPVGTATAPAN